MALSVGACGAWAPRAALDFFAECTGGAGRLPGQGAVADRGRSRCVVMVARALNLHLKRRRLYEGDLRPPSRSEKARVH
jgi:hypothetical protein